MKKAILLIMMCLGMTLNSFAQEEKVESNYDFWLGKWEATWDEADGKKGKGTNHIHRNLDGKVIQENFEVLEGKSKGFKGMSLSVYSPQKKVWKQAWADNQGGYFDFTGERDGDKRYFKTAVIQKGEQKIIQRMVFYNITKKSMTWDWEISTDGGENWKLSWRINYTKVKDVK